MGVIRFIRVSRVIRFIRVSRFIWIMRLLGLLWDIMGYYVISRVILGYYGVGLLQAGSGKRLPALKYDRALEGEVL